jgi:hypothetical protein
MEWRNHSEREDGLSLSLRETNLMDFGTQQAPSSTIAALPYGSYRRLRVR